MCNDRCGSEFPVLSGWAVPSNSLAETSIPGRIAAFLDGRTCGEDLLHELYDHILDEPIPDAMRAILDTITI
jgi:hypothetical protein